MRARPARSAPAALLALAAVSAYVLRPPTLGAQQAAPRPRSSADPAAIRAHSAAFRDTVDRALARGSARDSAARDGFGQGFPDDDAALQHPGLARRLAGGVSASLSRPIGDFRRGGRSGFGVAGFASISADPAGVLGLRLEGGTQSYGVTSFRTNSGAGLFTTNLRQITDNTVAWLGVGPQLTIPLGPLRPYGFATVGAAEFSTNTTLQYAAYGDPYGLTREFQGTDLSNWAFARAAGGGLRFRLPSVGRTAAYVDAGARWQRVSNVTYLAPGVIPADVDPNSLALRGHADFVTYHLGVSVSGR